MAGIILLFSATDDISSSFFELLWCFQSRALGVLKMSFFLKDPVYLKPWPVRIFEDWPFSSYIVAASESDEGLVMHNTVDIRDYGKLVAVCS